MKRLVWIYQHGEGVQLLSPGITSQLRHGEAGFSKENCIVYSERLSDIIQEKDINMNKIEAIIRPRTDLRKRKNWAWWE